MDERVLPRDIQGPIKIICHYCGSENPVKAYCCLNCFKVLRPKTNIPLWRLAMRPSVSFILAFMVLVVGGFYVMKRWIDAVEARVSMNLKTADYNISVVADKRRKGLIGDPAGVPDMDAIENGPTTGAQAPAAAGATESKKP